MNLDMEKKSANAPMLYVVVTWRSILISLNAQMLPSSSTAKATILPLANSALSSLRYKARAAMAMETPKSVSSLKSSCKSTPAVAVETPKSLSSLKSICKSTPAVVIETPKSVFSLKFSCKSTPAVVI